ncbi:hypothetical protein N7532_007041 [Penicillium argentinense]|uniref:Uncharacterized protein n=1 Tax=Penicillium argentinense TaxID=1131581 RepID=A0A9W9FGZ3_9EURO|nr:uncharacterized protein N7532_007041 [Penicillium argentinense]KAJ5100040.1 hypothetical protein N7532_007041 [Penicillium argentinense]
MSGFSKVMKDGWHPEGKNGKKESWRNDFKGINQVAGWMGKGKDPDSDRSDHVAQPLSSLKDPSSFAPPPKHVNYHGAAATVQSRSQSTSDQRGIGAPLSQSQVDHQNAQQQEAIDAEKEAVEKPKPPPVPYRVNTTGLSTNNLPPPPRRLDSPSSGSTSASASSKPKPSLPPRVPPRNPTHASNDDVPPPAYTPVAPSPSQGYINQEATSRLSNAGVSVPALGIGQANVPLLDYANRFGVTLNSASPPARSSTLPSQQGFRERHADKIDFGKQKLGGAKSRINTFVDDHRSSPAAPSPPSQSSTLPPRDAEDALPPAQGFRERHADKIDFGKQKLGGAKSRINTFVDDHRSSPAAPSPPSQSSTLPPRDAEDALPPAQGFRERHADKIDFGKQKLGGVTSRINALVEDQKFSANANKRIPRPPGANSPTASSPTASSAAGTGSSPVTAAPGATIEAQAQRKKAPPPPPPKRADIRAASAVASESPVSSSASTPPPLPLNSKPR